MSLNAVLRIVSAVYLLFLTALLLTTDPLRMIGVIRVGGEVGRWLRPLMPVAHLLSFFALALLILMARWPVPRWILVVLLVAYGGVTETAQRFLPPRTADWNDWLQDVAGVAVGAALCWGLNELARRSPAANSRRERGKDRP